MIKIGLCGSSGSGKGYVCKKLRSYGAEHIDTDKVYRELVYAGSPCLKELCQCFGEDILNDDGTLDRRSLSSKVFEGEGAKERLKQLNDISHRYIRTETKRLISEFSTSGAWAVLIDAPVLFESGFDDMCDCTVCVTAPTDLKIKRITERDGIAVSKAEARLLSQLTDDELRDRCDYEIVNDDSGDLIIRLEELVDKLKTKFEK